MGGSTKTTSTSTTDWPPEAREAMRMQNLLVQGQIPSIEELFTGAMRGDPLSSLPFTRGMIGPIQRQAQQAIEQIQRTMPAGGGRDMAIARIQQDAALGIGQQESSLNQNILAQIMALIQRQPPASGTTQTSKSGGGGGLFGLSLNVG